MSTQEKELDNKMFTAEERLDAMQDLLIENSDKLINEVESKNPNQENIKKYTAKEIEIEQRIDLLEQIMSLETEIERLEQNIQFEITIDS